jgi:hypothetical protein
MGLMYHGAKHEGYKMLLDDGSTTCLIAKEVVEKLGIYYEQRPMKLTTANGKSMALGITEPLTLHYGPLGGGLYTQHCFLVTDTPNPLYDLLISNQDFNTNRGILNMGKHTMTLRPQGQPPVVIHTCMLH